MSTNVPSLKFDDTGVSLPAESDIVAGVFQDINDSFGGNINPSLETPQGQLSSSIAAAIADKNSQIAYLSNQLDPSYSSGRFQDAIGRIYWMERIAGQGTSVIATCTGLKGVVIPQGAQAKDSSGNTYTSDSAGIIPDGGSINIPFTCTSIGPTPCPSGSLNVIYQRINGWDSINNASDGTLGRLVESRAEFEYRRKNSVAANAQGTNDAILGAVLAVPGVSDAYVTSNDTGAAVTIGATSYSIAAHSVYVAVQGGMSIDISRAIASKKPGGCGTNGTTTTIVYDLNYDYPQPSQTIKYLIPSGLPIKFAVSIQNNSNLPADITTQIKNAIVSSFVGSDGGTRARIGAQVVAGRFYGNVSKISPYVNILSILLGTSTPTDTSVTPGIDQIPTLSNSDITVTLA